MRSVIKGTILHIVQSEGAGVTEYLKMLIDNTKEYNNIIVGTSFYKLKEKFFIQRGYQVNIVPMKREIDFISDLKNIIRLRKIIKEINPDLIYLHSSKAGYLGRIANLGLNYKIIYNPHGWAFDMKTKKSYFYKVAEKILSLKTNKIINISTHEYDRAVDIGIDKKKLLVIKNAIDFERYKSKYDRKKTLMELKMPLNAFVIGTCGRISKQKDHDTFLRICQKISMKNKNAYFLIVGDGELREEIEEKAYRYNIRDKLRITGWVDETSKYIDIFDIALQTSQWEGFGLVLLEYILKQKIVVASRVGGIPEIIKDGETGFLAEARNIESFMEKIEFIENNKMIVDEIRKKATAMLYEKFSIKRLVEEHEIMYSCYMRRDIHEKI